MKTMTAVEQGQPKQPWVTGKRIAVGVLIVVSAVGFVGLIRDDAQPLPTTCAGINAERARILERNSALDPVSGFKFAKVRDHWRAGDWERNQQLIQAVADLRN